MSVDKTLKTQLKDYDVQEVAPKIYKINEYNLSTMFVIVGSERALCIDCGTGVGDYKAVIERLVEGNLTIWCCRTDTSTMPAAASSSTKYTSVVATKTL